MYTLDDSCTSISWKAKISKAVTTRGSSAAGRLKERTGTYHLEAIQLLLDRLRQRRRQSIARRDVSPAIVLPTAPGIVKLHLGAEADVPRRAGQALDLRSTADTAAEARHGGEVVLGRSGG